MKSLLTLLLSYIISSNALPIDISKSWCIDGVNYLSTGRSENGDVRIIYSTERNVWYFQPIPSLSNNLRVECIETGSELTKCTQWMLQDDIGTDYSQFMDPQEKLIEFGFCDFPDTFCIDEINYIMSDEDGRYYANSDESKYNYLFLWNDGKWYWTLVARKDKNPNWYQCWEAGIDSLLECSGKWLGVDGIGGFPEPTITSGSC